MKSFMKYIIHRIQLVLILSLTVITALLVFLFITASDNPYIFYVAAGFGVVFVLTLIYSYYYIIKPYRRYRKMLGLFLGGYTFDGVHKMENPFDEQSEELLEKLRSIMTSDKFINAGRRHAQYLALQNQINPHFLYNTLEGIRGEALAAGLDSVAEMTEALSTFFRYTISNVENFVTVEDELSNVENYFLIQQFRFGNRFELKYVYDESEWHRIKCCRLPKLILQPIAENSIIHGIERKIGNGRLTFRFTLTDRLLLITVSDDGVGMDSKTLETLNTRLNTADVDYIKSDGKKGGIGMVNVNNRIKLLFGEEYGLHVYSTVGTGTDVEINLPLIEKEE